jgi:hypothetical protein
MKNIIKKILKEDRRQMYLDRIIEVMKNDYPLFKNLKYYGLYDQLSEEELNYVFSGIFGEPVNKGGGRFRKNIYNQNGNMLYSEDSNGYWRKYEYNQNGNRIYYEDSNGYWEKYEYDNNENMLYFEDSTGFWGKSEYDDNGNEIYSENSNGFWKKSEYDDNGNRIYYENSDGKIYDRR